MLIVSLFAQQAPQYSFTRYNTYNGVTSNIINSITQDERGFMWIGTPNGLQRYDGSRFLTFKRQLGTEGSLPSDKILLVFSQKSKDVWLATVDNKVGIFKTGKNEYEEVPIDWKPPYNLYVRKKFIITSDGTLLLHIANHGVFIYDAAKKQFLNYKNGLPTPRGWKISDMMQDASTGRFWMAADSGIAMYDPATRHVNHRGNNTDNDEILKTFSQVRDALSIYSSSERFIIQSWSANMSKPTIQTYDRNTHKAYLKDLTHELNLGYHEVFGFLPQKNGRIWMFGLPMLADFSIDDTPMIGISNEYRGEQSIKFDRINTMFEDRESNVWIGSDNGIYLFNPDQQAFEPKLLQRPGSAAIEGPTLVAKEMRNGQIWIGTWGHGLYIYDKQFNPLPVPRALSDVKEKYSIWSLQEEENGRVWLGLQSGVLLIHDSAGGTKKLLIPEFGGSTIRQITADRNGDLWFGTQRGEIIRWNRKAANNDPSRGYTLMKRTGLVVKLFTDSRGMIWVSTEGRGLWMINPDNASFRLFNTGLPEGFKLSADAPSDVLQYNDSTLMVANGAIDVINLNNYSISSITTAQGLPSNNVLCLQKDESNMLWLGMISGLYRMNLKSNIATTYDRRDGMGYDNFNGAGAFKLKGGRLLFTTDHNFVVFMPERLSQKEPPPDVKILDFKVLGRGLYIDSVRALSKVTLDYNKNSVTIDFGTLSFLRKNKKAFYYKLDKFDADWIQADDRRQATYNYIPSGTYTFMVKAVNGYGIPSNITKLIIYVKAPFWKTWWFYALLTLVVFGILYIIDRERFRRMMTLQQVRRQIAGNLHSEISKTLSNIHLLSEIAKIKADKDLEKSIEYIDQINTKSSRMIDAMDDMLWSLDPKNDSMLKTLERMSEFAEGMKHSHGCEINLVVDEKVNKLRLDMKARHDIYFIFKESLSHIISFSNCTDSIIDIDLVHDNLLIKIHDNGNNLDNKLIRNSPTMQEIQKRAEELNAILDIQSDKRGTAVILQVPVR